MTLHQYVSREASAMLGVPESRLRVTCDHCYAEIVPTHPPLRFPPLSWVAYLYRGKMRHACPKCSRERFEEPEA